jgi:hypothetical protein
MSYRLVLSPALTEGGAAKDFGENIFLEQLDAEYKVFLFYYPGNLVDAAMEKKLKGLGGISGKNLFVNIGRLNDPSLDKIAKSFSIRNYPVVVVTATSPLASPPEEHLSAFALLDNKAILSSPERTCECVQALMNLFLQGKVSEAVSHAKWAQRAAATERLVQMLAGPLKALGGFIAGRDLTVSIAEGKFELKKSGG